MTGWNIRSRIGCWAADAICMDLANLVLATILLVKRWPAATDDFPVGRNYCVIWLSETRLCGSLTLGNEEGGGKRWGLGPLFPFTRQPFIGGRKTIWHSDLGVAYSLAASSFQNVHYYPFYLSPFFSSSFFFALPSLSQSLSSSFLLDTSHQCLFNSFFSFSASGSDFAFSGWRQRSWCTAQFSSWTVCDPLCVFCCHGSFVWEELALKFDLCCD